MVLSVMVSSVEQKNQKFPLAVPSAIGTRCPAVILALVSASVARVICQGVPAVPTVSTTKMPLSAPAAPLRCSTRLPATRVTPSTAASTPLAFARSTFAVRV